MSTKTYLTIREPDNTFVLSDSHFDHTNVIRFDGRRNANGEPFQSAEEMNIFMVEQWNSVVRENSLVLYLGDLSMNHRIADVIEVLNALNGRKIFIRGNHDYCFAQRPTGELIHPEILSYVEQLRDYIECRVHYPDGLEQHVVLSHFPLFSWHWKDTKGINPAWHLHGHCHNNLSHSTPNGYYKNDVLDVHCCKYNYIPQSFTQIREEMERKRIA